MQPGTLGKGSKRGKMQDLTTSVGTYRHARQIYTDSVLRNGTHGDSSSPQNEGLEGRVWLLCNKGHT